MWIAGIAAGAAALFAGFVVKDRKLRLAFKIVGVMLILISLIYGGLVLILLGGID